MRSRGDPRSASAGSGIASTAAWDLTLGPAGLWIAASTVCFAVIAMLRLAANDPAIALAALYSFPVGILALRFGIRGGLVGSIVAVLLLIVDSAELSAVGVLSRMSVVLLVGVGIGLIVDRMRQLTDELRVAIEDSERNYWHLRRVAEVLPICMDCGDVREGHEWMDVADYMRRNAEFLSHGLCPACEERRHAALDEQLAERT